ncbi:hypothetical protein AB1Y20_016319 [Prymnesium parvum]|uniref:Centrosomal protein of 162 kDa n=1 Tax=Prymnesium parvum TaxID=97485 RepID=A0AB34IEF7_PRYPA
MAENDSDDDLMKSAFWQEMDERYGGPISLDQIWQWSAQLSDDAPPDGPAPQISISPELQPSGTPPARRSYVREDADSTPRARASDPHERSPDSDGCVQSYVRGDSGRALLTRASDTPGGSSNSDARVESYAREEADSPLLASASGSPGGSPDSDVCVNSSSASFVALPASGWLTPSTPHHVVKQSQGKPTIPNELDHDVVVTESIGSKFHSRVSASSCAAAPTTSVSFAPTICASAAATASASATTTTPLSVAPSTLSAAPITSVSPANANSPFEEASLDTAEVVAELEASHAPSSVPAVLPPAAGTSTAVAPAAPLWHCATPLGTDSSATTANSAEHSQWPVVTRSATPPMPSASPPRPIASNRPSAPSPPPRAASASRIPRPRSSAGGGGESFGMRRRTATAQADEATRENQTWAEEREARGRWGGARAEDERPRDNAGEASGRARTLEAEVRAAKAEARAAGRLAALRKAHQQAADEWRAREAALTAELADARAKCEYRAHVVAGGTLNELSLSEDELRRIEDEVRQQETLICGYQKENERLSEALKASREAHRTEVDAAVDEARRLQLQLVEARERQEVQAPEGLRAQLERAHAHAAQVQEQASIRETELRFEIDRLRVAKRELEARVGGVDLQQLASENERLTAAEAALEARDAAHREEVAALRAKLRWYTENQQLISEVEGQLDEARARTTTLEALLETAPAGGVGTARGPSEGERVQLLERQVEALARLLEARGEPKAPEAGKESAKGGGRRGAAKKDVSVAELVAAAGPSAQEVQRLEYLAGRVEQLEAQCAEAESATQRRLRSLRQQHERVVHGYEARLGSMSAALKKMEAAEAAHAKTSSARMRVRELEKQVEEVRAFYGKRVRELEAKLADATKKGAKRPPSTRQSPNAGAAHGTGGSGETDAQPGVVDATHASDEEGGTPTHPVLLGGGAPSLRPREAGTAPLHNLEVGPPPASACDGAPMLNHSSIADEDVFAAFAVAGSSAAALEKVNSLAVSLLHNVGSLEASLAASGEDIRKKGDEGAEVCSAGEVLVLQQRLRLLEASQRDRYLEAHSLAKRTQRLAYVEAELEAKNAEVEHFRTELDELVLQIRLLHAHQKEAVALAAVPSHGSRRRIR